MFIVLIVLSENVVAFKFQHPSCLFEVNPKNVLVESLQFKMSLKILFSTRHFICVPFLDHVDVKFSSRWTVTLEANTFPAYKKLENDS